MTKQDIIGEITALKSFLAESDYSILKTLEGLFDCTSATGIITFLKNLTTEIVQLKRKRQQWRERINELEALLDATPDELAEGNTDN